MRCQICNALLKSAAEEAGHLKLHSDFNSNNPNNLSDQNNSGEFSGKLGEFIPLQLRLKCQICNLGFSTHKQLKNHKWDAHFKERQPENSVRKTNCLIIKGFDKRPQDFEIIDYFSKYGKIITFNIFKHAVEVNYQNAKSAKRAIKKARYWKDVIPLRVRYKMEKINKPTIKKPKIVTEAKDTLDLVSQLACVSDTNQQFEIVKFMLSTSNRKEYDEKLQTLGTDLEVVAKRLKDDANVYLFGSSTTKLNFPTSGPDIYIDSKAINTEPFETLKTLKTYMEETKKFDNVFIRRLVQVPKIRCVHIPTKLNCAINVSYPLGVCNSKLIRNILDIDDKLRNVMLFLKYLFQHNKLTKENGFKNYTFCIMFIFYLQVTFKLPPINEFNKIEQYRQIHGGWNGGLDPFDPTAYKQNFITLSYHEILQKFFLFYENFDYERTAICPFIGRAILKTSLRSPAEIPDEYIYYKSKMQDQQITPINSRTFICVQDPFEHNSNLTVTVKECALTAFINLCRSSSRKCDQGQQSLLYNLLTPNLLSPKPAERQKIDCTFCLKRRKNINYLDENRPIEEAWLKIVCEFTKVVFEDFLKIEINEKDEEPHHIETRLNCMQTSGQIDGYHQPGRVAMTCCTKIDLWGGRESNIPFKIKKKIAGLNFMDRELKVTEILLQRQDFQGENNILSFDLVIECNNDADKAYFIMSDYVPTSYKKKVYISFRRFFVTKMPKWFHQYENYLFRKKKSANKK